MTPEQMLVAVIEAQVKGGCDRYDPFIDGRETTLNGDGNYLIGFGKLGSKSSCHVLEILLDPQGLRAAYGEDPQVSDPPPPIGSTFFIPTRWQAAADRILRAWLSTPDGDPEAAIRTAYDLLPKP